jgi:hypothetical protein
MNNVPCTRDRARPAGDVAKLHPLLTSAAACTSTSREGTLFSTHRISADEDQRKNIEKDDDNRKSKQADATVK